MRYRILHIILYNICSLDFSLCIFSKIFYRYRQKVNIRIYIYRDDWIDMIYEIDYDLLKIFDRKNKFSQSFLIRL